MIDTLPHFYIDSIAHTTYKKQGWDCDCVVTVAVLTFQDMYIHMGHSLLGEGQPDKNFTGRLQK